jgi:hypothetical protein
MKKIRNGIILMLALLLCLSSTVFASAAESSTQDNGFEYSGNELSEEIESRIANGETNFTIKRNFDTQEAGLGNEIGISVWITESTTDSVTPAARTVNWALSGRYYFTSSDETVSNYGNHGSVDYTGTSLEEPFVWDAYHDVTYKYRNQYEARSSESESEVTENSKNGVKFLGKYRLKNSSTGEWCSDGEIYIIVFVDGSWRSKGNYDQINVD